MPVKDCWIYRRIKMFAGNMVVILALVACSEEPRAPTENFQLTCTEYVTQGHATSWEFAVSPNAGTVTIVRIRRQGKWSNFNRKGRYSWQYYDGDQFYFPPPGKPGRPKTPSKLINPDPEYGAWGVTINRETRRAAVGTPKGWSGILQLQPETTKKTYIPVLSRVQLRPPCTAVG